jgi:hypothetical protein
MGFKLRLKCRLYNYSERIKDLYVHYKCTYQENGGERLCKM